MTAPCRSMAGNYHDLKERKQGMPPTASSDHGGTIVRTVACGVHPLLCRTFTEPPPEPKTTSREHSPRITLDRTRIVGCTCGWRTPPGTADSEDAYIEHVTVLR